MNLLLRRVAHYAIYVVALALITVSGLALVLRVWVLPDIDRYRPRLENLISEATGLPASIGVIRADWQGLNPRLQLEALRLGEGGDQAPLVLPRVDAVASWSSLLLGEVRLSELTLSRPRVEISRDRNQVIRVAGLPVNTGGEASPFPDWLLSQRLIVVRDGQVTWRDEMLDAPPLDLRQVKLVLYSRFGRHRLGLTAQPQGSAGRKLDLRADIKGDSIRRLDDFRGQVYVYLEQASAEALRTWAPWAQEAVREGHGSLRLWMDFARQQITGLLGDVRLNQVRLSLTGDTPDMEFSHLIGRLGWRRGPGGHDIHIDRLDFASPSGLGGEPASARVHLAPDAAGKPRQVTVTASDLQLETLTALSGAVPLPRAAHDLIGRLKPRGFVSRLRVDWRRTEPTQAQMFDGLGQIVAEASFRDVGMASSGQLPGLSGLSGDARMDARGGQINLRARHLGLEYDPVFRNPLNFDVLDADVAWQRTAQGGYAIRVDGVRAANSDLDGTAQIGVTLRPGQSPQLDIQAQLQRGEGDMVWRYLPHQIADDAYRWIKRSILSGTAEQGTLVLRGPADRFPFDQGGGTFDVKLGLRDVELGYASGWPVFQRINGQLLFHDKAMEIIADGGQVAHHGIRLSGVHGVVPDIHYPVQKTLFIKGQADGDADAFLGFIRRSPVYDYTDRFTEHMRGTGNARLDLSLDLPLREVEDTQVRGSLRLLDASLDPGEGVPVLEHLQGELQFTHKALKAREINAVVLGQPARLDLESLPGGRVRAALNGRMPAQGLGGWLPTWALRYLDGSASYRAELDVKQHQAELRLASDLEGLAIALPTPLGKKADAKIPLLLVKTLDEQNRDVVYARYGQILTARAMPGGEGEKPRLGISIGRGEAAMPSQSGLTLQAVLKRFDLAEWRALVPAEAGGGEPVLPPREINLTANELVVANRVIHDGNIVAQPRAGGWHLRIASREVQGEVDLTGKEADLRVTGKFRRLQIPDPVKGDKPEAAAQTKARRQLFSGHIEADTFAIKDKELGALRLDLESVPHGWRLRHLGIQNPDGGLSGEGLLADHARRPSQLKLKVDSPDLSALLTRLGYPGYLKRGKTQAEGELNWMGGLEDFDLADLSGKLSLDIRDGQFVKVDPGVGRLLGIVSLQSLPRRITLDFRDVFSEGFAFDEISGPLVLDRGVAYLAKLKMSGPAAQVEMKGQIDLARESQDLRVRVQPRLEDTLAAGALLINPAVGVGALVASKVLKDPISKAVSFEYLVTGQWDDPQVTKIKRPNARQEAP